MISGEKDYNDLYYCNEQKKTMSRMQKFRDKKHGYIKNWGMTKRKTISKSAAGTLFSVFYKKLHITSNLSVLKKRKFCSKESEKISAQKDYYGNLSVLNLFYYQKFLCIIYPNQK